MLRGVIVIAIACGACLAGYGQGMAQDILMGNLVNPQVGDWTWYDLKDTATGKVFLLRLAVVGTETVDGKTGHWLEVEVAPPEGFNSVYKMLLTGPASDPANIHKVVRRTVSGKAEDVPIEATAAEKAGASGAETSNRVLAGSEEISTPGGALKAEHYTLTQEGRQVDLWINDAVKPMGLVCMKAQDGELTLKSHGNGGPDAQSSMDKTPGMAAKLPEAKVEVRVDDKQPKPAKPARKKP